jgi:hypothetical protein
MVVYTCNLNTSEVEKEDHEFQANLGYIVRPCLKRKRKKKVQLIGIREKVVNKILE